jgi:pilus assembly protein CpaD
MPKLYAASPAWARRRTAAALASLAALALLAGCETDRHSVIVGSVPDDYRTAHPIVVGEKEMVLDLPVAASERGITGLQAARLEGFLENYDPSAAPVMRIMAPVGSYNEEAARLAARDFAGRAKLYGVPASRIAMTTYAANPDEANAPVRVVFMAVRAYTPEPCGRWPKDIADTSDNKHYADFGCSMQNNVAAQVANPTDLLGPRKRGEIDAENRNEVIETYRRDGTATFRGPSEIEY